MNPNISSPAEGKILAFFKKYVKFRSSIYSRVVYIITISSFILFVFLGIIFRSVYEQYLNTVIRQSGNNIGSIVEGSLYHSMMENDKSALQSTLDVINTMSGIDDVNMYDSRDSLVYTSFSPESGTHSNPNCILCHRVGGPGGNPHPGGWMSSRSRQSDTPCRYCHGT